jgi:hypothetical protein
LVVVVAIGDPLSTVVMAILAADADADEGGGGAIGLIDVVDEVG